MDTALLPSSATVIQSLQSRDRAQPSSTEIHTSCNVMAALLPVVIRTRASVLPVTTSPLCSASTITPFSSGRQLSSCTVLAEAHAGRHTSSAIVSTKTSRPILRIEHPPS